MAADLEILLNTYLKCQYLEWDSSNDWMANFNISRFGVNAYLECQKICSECLPDRQTDRYFIDREKGITDLFVILPWMAADL